MTLTGDSLVELETEFSRSTMRQLFPVGCDIDAVLKGYERVCHPDRFPADERDRAGKLFAKLGVMADEARMPPVIITSKRATYTLSDRKYIGDIADIYETPEGELVKVCRIVGAGKYMATEAKVLQELRTKAGTRSYQYYLPEVLESFPAREKHVTVFPPTPGHYVPLDIIAKDYAITGRDTGWMFKRGLEILGFCHNAGYVNCGMLPPHLLYSIEHHGLLLLGWPYALKTGTVQTVVSAKYKASYPAEITGKKPVGPGTDIFMLAECMLDALGPFTDLSKSDQVLYRFYSGCTHGTLAGRPNDAWKLLRDEFSPLLKKLYGPPAFHDLVPRK